MKNSSEDLKKTLEEELKVRDWQQYICGKVDGALNVLYAMDLDKEKRLELLQEAVGLTRDTATSFLEPREIEYRIRNNTTLSGDDKWELLELMENEALKDETVLSNPIQTLNLIAAVGDNHIIDECIPRVEQWEENGEEISMLKVRNWLIEKYDLF